MKNKDLSFVVVNYQSKKQIEACFYSFESFLKKEDISHEWIIINNSPKENLSSLKRDNVSIKTSLNNEGFARACNKGVQEAQGKIIWFLNPDTRYIKGDVKKSIQRLLCTKNPELFGFHLVNENGETQAFLAGKKLSLFSWFSGKMQKKDFRILAERKNTPVDWVSGASLLMRKQDIESLGGFDEGFFMYFEDMDLCARFAQKLQGRCWYSKEITLLHEGGSSFHGNIQKQKRWYYDSFLYYVKKHRPWGEYIFFRLVIFWARYRLWKRH